MPGTAGRGGLTRAKWTCVKRVCQVDVRQVDAKLVPQ